MFHWENENEENSNKQENNVSPLKTRQLKTMFKIDLMNYTNNSIACVCVSMHFSSFFLALVQCVCQPFFIVSFCYETFFFLFSFSLSSLIAILFTQFNCTTFVYKWIENFLPRTPAALAFSLLKRSVCILWNVHIEIACIESMNVMWWMQFCKTFYSVSFAVVFPLFLTIFVCLRLWRYRE